ncbi:hypothetical protein K503DRAFT_868735 [Rhizopogon vinicolor AM-OR11-026]|uniref:F-box domain-containing protein n=1 Tax=Rhizopogon vinicolor AM-OR11-026 TaxID=1314800 RepID=A0A1B7MQ55_9AGAM|nr:hypothetical protein K503DRAFT_868735 [Rhizopogon vinicolor AM-OR11-026]
MIQNSGYIHVLRSQGSTRGSIPSINIQDLPDEVLFIILEFVDVLDADVLHKVSKLFYRLLHDECYWRTAYRKTRIPRPPGPFEGQPTSYLRETLIRSAKVQLNWPPFVWSPHPTSRITFSRVALSAAKLHLSIIHGRWLITGDSPLMLCYDTCSSNPDWATSPQIFYQPHLTANFFRCFSMTAEDGQELIFAVSDTQVGTVRRKLNLFTITIDPGYGPFISGHVFTLDLRSSYSGVQAVATGPRLLVISAKGLEHEDPPIILDVKTFQRFQIVSSPLAQGHHVIVTSFISTSSYLFVARLLNGWETLLQVFPISQTHSQSSTDGIRVLRPSHVMKTPELRFHTWHVLRGPKYEPSTGGTRITLMLSVLGPTSMDVASLNIVHLLLDAGGNISFTPKMLWTLPRDTTVLADSSHDGCIRGLVCSENGRRLMPFVIDDQDENSTVCGLFSNDITTSFKQPLFLFDGYRGVLCSESVGAGGWRIEVVRFA